MTKKLPVPSTGAVVEVSRIAPATPMPVPIELRPVPVPAPVVTPAESIAGGLAAAADRIVERVAPWSRGTASGAYLSADAEIEHQAVDGSRTVARVRLHFHGARN